MYMVVDERETGPYTVRQVLGSEKYLLYCLTTGTEVEGVVEGETLKRK